MLKQFFGAVMLCLIGLPAFAAAQNEAEGWTPLFDGKTLNGWKASENPGSFRVENGRIVADGPRAHLFYVGTAEQPADYRCFELEAEVLSGTAANSGIYFHTAYLDQGWPKKGFEVQVNNTNRPQEGEYKEFKKTGSLYGIRNVYKSLVPDGQWFKMNVVVRGKRVLVRVNGTLVVDYVEPVNIAAALDPNHAQRRLDHGTFALQCHDEKSKAFFRDIRVRRLPDTLPTDVIAGTYDELDQQIMKLQMSNFPLVDFHVHLKGGLTLEETLARSRRLGINYGIAVNCGVGFPITDDQGIDAFFKTVAGQPVFIGMQAEGREWPKLFSKQAIARFDYVFTDGMTITGHRGRRTRLWMKDEVEIPDKQAFMDHLVDTIVGILEHEPIDIYVNPTYLPDVLAGEYDLLWTPERVKRVIDAAAKNGVAIEISNKYNLPKPAFIRQAKAAGIKFTFGTNNADGNFGREEYALQMVRECGLTWQDMWLPKPDGQKPVQVKNYPWRH